MHKFLIILLSLFTVFFTSCSVLKKLDFSYHYSKMDKVEDETGLNEDYSPNFFRSSNNFTNIRKNNNFHMYSKVYTKDDGEFVEFPVDIAWGHYFGEETDKNGPDVVIVLLPGSAGSYMQFNEYMYDIQKSMNDKVSFFFMDQRGQGFSSWLNPNNIDGFNGLYVDNFDYYVDDLHYFYRNIVHKYVSLMEHTYNRDIPVVAFGHSLGGAIVVKYLETYQEDFDGAILSSPAIKPLNWLNRSAVFYWAYWAAQYGWGAIYIPWGKNIHEPLPYGGVFCYTGSRKRWDYWQHVCNPDYFNDRELVHPGTKGEILRMSFPTVWWLYQLITGTEPLNTKENAAKITAPYLILLAEEEDLVSPAAIDILLKNSRPGLGELVFLKDSKHDIMLEKDEVRNKSFEAIKKFLDKLLESNR